MSDSVHTCSTTNLEALADEVRAEHRGTFKRRRSPKYAGLASVTYRRKYSNCERVRVNGSNVRLLSAREIDEFRAAMARCVEQPVAARYVLQYENALDQLPGYRSVV